MVVAAVAGTLLAGLSQAAPLRYAEDRGPSIVNPLFSTTMSEARLDELVFEGLFADDTELRSTPRLALSSDVDDDKMAMTIRLRPDVVWHDGEPFDATDVVFTIDAYRDPQTASTEVGRVSWIKRAFAMDPYTVRIEFKSAEYEPQDKLHFKILPSHRFNGTVIRRTDAFRNTPIGTGPFRVASFNEDNSITMERHTRHWDPARLDAMAMREVPDKNYQADLLRYESLEALVRVLPRDLATLQNDRTVELYPYQTNSWWYVGMNQARGPLRDDKVRQALSLMVNVDDLLAPIGTGDRVSGPFVPSSPFYNHDVPNLPHDPQRAVQLLQEAGYTMDGGVWKRRGKPLKLGLVASSDLQIAMEVVINVQSQLQSQGIVVEPQFLQLAEYRNQVWSERTFDLVLSLWSFDRSEDIYENFHSKGSYNFIGYRNAEVDVILDESRRVADPQKKKAMMRNVHRLISADHPMVFLWTLDSYAALSTKVRAVNVHPFYFFTWSSDWVFEP